MTSNWIFHKLSLFHVWLIKQTESNKELWASEGKEPNPAVQEKFKKSWEQEFRGLLRRAQIMFFLITQRQKRNIHTFITKNKPLSTPVWGWDTVVSWIIHVVADQQLPPDVQISKSPPNHIWKPSSGFFRFGTCVWCFNHPPFSRNETSVCFVPARPKAQTHGNPATAQLWVMHFVLFVHSKIFSSR